MGRVVQQAKARPQDIGGDQECDYEASKAVAGTKDFADRLWDKNDIKAKCLRLRWY